MQVMVRLRAARRLALLLLSAFLMPYPTCGAWAAQPNDAPTQTVLLFPMDNNAQEDAAKLADELTAFLKDRLTAYPRYMVIMYSDRLPAAQRLISIYPDKKDMAAGPFSTDQAATSKALVLARETGASLAVVGSLDKYDFIAEKGEAEVMATCQALDVKTGKAIRTVTAAGHAKKSADVESVTESRIASQAVKEVGRKIAVEVIGEDYQATQKVQKVTTGAKSRKNSWLLVLLSLGVGLLLAGGGDSGGGSETLDQPPAPPPF